MWQRCCSLRGQDEGYRNIQVYTKVYYGAVIGIHLYSRKKGVYWPGIKVCFIIHRIIQVYRLWVHFLDGSVLGAVTAYRALGREIPVAPGVG